MADYVTLLGAEDVRRAASTMAEAAQQMERAAGNMEAALHQHRVFLDQWLFEFREAITALRDAPAEVGSDAG